MFGHHVISVLFVLVTGILVSAYTIKVVIKIARLRGLTDQADFLRKIHKGQTPTLGGIAIFFSVIIAYSLWVGDNIADFYPYLIVSLMILFATGMKDDILEIDSKKKFFLQLLAALILVVPGDVRLLEMDGFLGLGLEMSPPMAPSLIFVVSIFTFVVIVNSYNLIDGIDGLAGSQALFATFAFGTWFYINGHLAETILAAALAGSLIGFLYHNKEPAKIFMGDTGSLVIGFVLATLAFRLIKLNAVSTGWQFEKPTVYAFAAMIVPMFDTLRVIFLRLLNGCSPFIADNRHIHHCLLRFGYTHNGICGVLLFTSLVILIVATYINPINIHYTLLILLGMAGLMLPLAWLINRSIYKRDKEKHGRLISKQAILRELIRPCFFGLTEGNNQKRVKKKNSHIKDPADVA